MSRSISVLLFGTLALAGCREQVVTVPTGLRGEARTNPLLAAQRTLQRLGVESRIQYGLGTLPMGGETLLTAEGALSIDGPILTGFLDWVEGGGRAIVCLDGFAVDTSLFGALGLDEDDEFYFPEEETAPWLGRRSALLEALALERIDGDDYWKDLLGFDVELRSQDGLLLSGDVAEPAFEIDLGDGRVTVMTSGRIFNNQELGDEQHAELLYELVTESEPPEALVIAYVETPGLWGLLTTRAPYALWGGLALLLLWLWKSWPRFGPVENLDSLGTAGFRTHAAAVGRFLWKHDRGPALLRSVRKATLADLRSRIPASGGLDPAALSRVLAERTGQDADDIEHALFSDGPMRPEALVAAQRALTQLRARS